MFRIVQLTDAARTKRYYTGGGHPEGGDGPGVWGGRGAGRLGLAGAVDPDDFARLCHNLDPATGAQLTPRTRTYRRVGYDLSFHPPKSLSVVTALGGDPALPAAVLAAAVEALAGVEGDARVRVRAGGGREERPTGCLVWAAFVHRTARPVGGTPDPHLHVHAVVFNATFDPAEGRWKALDLSAAWRDAPYHEAVFHARLAARVRTLRYPVRRTAGGWELAGVPDRILREFSRRTRVVEGRAEALGLSDPRAKARLGVVTREPAARAAGWDDLPRAWAARLGPEERVAVATVCRRDGVGDDPPVSPRVVLAEVSARLFDRRALIPEREFLAHALRAGAGWVDVAGVRAAYPSLGVLVRPVRGVPHVATRVALTAEAKALALARAGRGACGPLGHGPYPPLESAVFSSRDRVTLAYLPPGHTRAAVSLLEAAGRPVLVLDPHPGAGGTGTLARFLADPTYREPVRGGVVWVEAADELGYPAAARLFALVRDLGGRVVLAGGPRGRVRGDRGSLLDLLTAEAGLVAARPAVRPVRPAGRVDPVPVAPGRLPGTGGPGRGEGFVSAAPRPASGGSPPRAAGAFGGWQRAWRAWAGRRPGYRESQEYREQDRGPDPALGRGTHEGRDRPVGRPP
ncbi:MAG: relaxase domain-containing protein [Gemmataceae bacterium]|nr:relaxase domain-containing protein [Gemmataceae bacterium]